MCVVRDWSLITGRGAIKREGGGVCEVLPLQKKGGGGIFLSHAEGGGTKSSEVVCMR